MSALLRQRLPPTASLGAGLFRQFSASRDISVSRGSKLVQIHIRPTASPHLKPAALISRSGATLVPSNDPSPRELPPAVYVPPTTGILSYLPSSWVPYAELARIEKPTGTVYLWFPTIWSTFMAASMTTPLAPVTGAIYTSALFTTGALIMRGAGCTINDLWDQNIDDKVTRTRFRPLARRAITPTNAVLFAGVQCLAGLAVLLQFPMEVIVAGIPSMILVSTYPGMKRITNYPQAVLGAAFGWGTMLGFPAMGISLMEPTIATTAACLFLSNVAWTVLYDTIYALQDIKDDKKIGVKSTAIANEGRTKVFLSALGIAQVSLLAGAGYISGLGPIYFAWSCGGTALANTWMIRRLNIKDPSDCSRWFKWCAWTVGGVAVSGGLMAEYGYRKLYEKDDEGEIVDDVIA